ncbi:hypothetical protein [Microbulbifer sp. JMSA003]|uniref:hypothetical protein n=1 Tax=Microbulbifer sp. JMSA003 TaxID=3243369 RepID=UPI004039BE6A
MKIYLHIGSDKTGSTAIQNALFQNRIKLKTLGIEYPKLLKNEPHHESLVRELRLGEKGDSWRALGKVIASNPPHLIISAEALCTLNSAEITRLKAWLNHSNICVIAYLRRADEYLESGTLQRLKTAKSLKEFTRRYLIAKYVPAILDPYVYTAAFKAKFINKWNKVFSGEIKIRPYEKKQWKNYDLIEDFFAHLNLHKVQDCIKSESLNQNVTLDIASIYAISILTRNKLYGLRWQMAQAFTKDPTRQKKGALLSRSKRTTAHIISKAFNYLKVRPHGITFSSDLPPKSIGLPRLTEVITTAENIIANQLAEMNARRANLRQRLDSYQSRNLTTQK